MPEKYLNRIVTIIYQAKDNQITQRRVRIQSIAGECVRVFDLDKRAPRVFEAGRILAMQPEGMRA